MSEDMKYCPFCGEDALYKIQRENELGTIIPQLFCNNCKMIFEVENDSPYLNDEETHNYLEEKLHKLWNTRKPIERIVERLEESKGIAIDERGEVLYQEDYFIDIDDTIAIVKEEGE